MDDICRCSQVLEGVGFGGLRFRLCYLQRYGCFVTDWSDHVTLKNAGLHVNMLHIFIYTNCLWWELKISDYHTAKYETGSYLEIHEVSCCTIFYKCTNFSMHSGFNLEILQCNSQTISPFSSLSKILKNPELWHNSLNSGSSTHYNLLFTAINGLFAEKVTVVCIFGWNNVLIVIK